MRLLIVLLLLAAPANAVTYRLTGSSLDACVSHVYASPEAQEPDPTPCIGKVGKSFDGRVTLPDRLAKGWVFSQLADPSLFPGAAIVPLSAVRVNLRFRWQGSRSFAMHFDDAGNLDTWWFTTRGKWGTNEAASSGIHIARPTFFANGSGGAMVAQSAARKAVAASPSPVPIPAAGWLLLAATLATACWRTTSRYRYR
jgi:hypothetical protein